MAVPATMGLFPSHTVHCHKLRLHQRIFTLHSHTDTVRFFRQEEIATLGGNSSNYRSGSRLSSKAHLQKRSDGQEAREDDLRSRREEEHMWSGSGREASGWELEESRVYFFAAAGAESLMVGGALLEEVLKDGLDAAKKAGRPRDVWLVMEPAFLRDHPGLGDLYKKLEKPTAAIVTTNGDWVLTTVKKLLPQTVLGKFRAPSPFVPNPFESTLNPTGAVVGGGSVWH